MEEFNNDENLLKAAKAIVEAEIFVICIGAGMSADSGLAVYKDVANLPVYNEMGIDYADICTPMWLDDDPELFYGFWGMCFNDYRDAVPHEGYHILRRICETRFNKDSDGARYFDGDTAPYFIYSSNVDEHCLKAGFPKENVHEIHGSKFFC